MHAITYRCLYHLIQYSLWNCGWKLSNFLPIEKSITKAKSNRENAQLYPSNVGKICPKLHKNLISPLFFIGDFAFLCQNPAHIGILLPKLDLPFLSQLVLSKWQRLEVWSLMHCTIQQWGGGVHMEREFKLLKLATTVAGHLSQLINFPKANMRKIFLV